MNFVQIAALVTLLMVYGFTFYFAQSPISRNKRNRRAFHIAFYSLIACFLISMWLADRMPYPVDVSMAIALGAFALSSVLVMSRSLFVSIRTGRQLARGVVYDRQRRRLRPAS
jgi:hypothetical protein